MRAWLRAVLLGAALAAPAVPAAGVHAADGPPSVTVDRTGTFAGEELLVTGTGWQPGTLVKVELCGNAGRGGSVDCDVANGRAVTTSADGAFSTALTAGLPPRPCPCVILADSQSTAESATVEIAVAGMVTVPLDRQQVTAEVRRELEIAGVRVDGRGPWQSWFGAAPERRLVVTLHNSGDVPLRDPPLAIAVGAGEDPDRIVPAPAVGRLEPGQVRILEIPLELDSFTIGERTVRVEVLGFPDPIVAEATTSAYPWGLAVLAVLLVQALLLLVRNRLRARIERSLPAPVAAPDDVPAAPALPGAAALPGAPTLPAAPELAGASVPLAIGAAPRAEPLALAAPALEAPAAVAVPVPYEAWAADGNGVDQSELDRILEEHRRATADLAAWVVTKVVREGDATRAELEACRSEAAIALRRAHDLAEALVAAGGARATELLAAAEAHDAEAARRHQEAGALLEEARVRADELLAAATAAAHELEEQARAEREQARAAYQAARVEGAELLEGARRELAALLAGLEQRIEDADHSTQDALRALLTAASEQRSAWQREGGDLWGRPPGHGPHPPGNGPRSDRDADVLVLPEAGPAEGVTTAATGWGSGAPGRR
jgi:hypothetical protein